MTSYCVKEKKYAEDVPGSERARTSKNGRRILLSICSSCGAKKSRFIKLQEGGYFVDAFLEGATKGTFNLGKKALKRALRSTAAKNYASKHVKKMSNKLIDQGVSKSLDKFAKNI